MKKQLYILSAVTGMFFMISCSHRPSEEAKKKLASFDSAWSMMSTMAKTDADFLNTTVSNCENSCKAGDAMECCEHTKTAKDSLMDPCKNDMAVLYNLKKLWDAQTPMWDSLNTALNTLKEKVVSGKTNVEEINKTVNAMHIAMDNGNKGMQEFMTRFNDAKMTCMKNMESCKAGWVNVKCTDKKCPMGKKMMEMAKKKS